MPNKPDINTVIITAQVDRETGRRLDKLAAAKKESRSKTAASILRDGLADVALTEDDYRKIADDIEAARRNRNR